MDYYQGIIHMKLKKFVTALGLSLSMNAQGQVDDTRLDIAAAALEAKVVAWRRDIHQHPELGNREVRTAALVAEHLRGLGYELRTGVAHTGVVGILRGGRPGPIIALRADMDALPVAEQNDLPFKSTVIAEYAGQQVGVMHACGHDTHVAMLMGIAQVLAELRAELPGTVMLIFQPAEEGPPEGERGGAELMLAEGLFAELRPEAVFGMHVMADANTGVLQYRSGPMFAAVNTFDVKVTGRQTHGARPWQGIDPVVTSALIINGLQTIVSRQTDIAKLPAVLTIGSIHGGIRHNIIPDAVIMQGTLRTFDTAMRDDIVARMRRTVESTAAASGASAELIMRTPVYPATINDPALTARVLPSLQRAVGATQVRETPLVTAAEDFAYFAREVPGFYFLVGVTPPGKDPATAPMNHSPLFHVDESALAVGMKAMLYLTVDYLQSAP